MTSISIIGASGAVGSTLATHILRSGLLQEGDRIQLVARGVDSSSMKLLSMRIDLMDAFDDQGIEIEVVANIEDVDGDIIVVCAGVSLQGRFDDRRKWGTANRDVYEAIAETCARRVPNAFFIVVSNPVELAVRIFAEKLGRMRVLGMGAEQDSLRFARAIAHDLGMSRHDVFASVLGEHGQAMIPLWSSVRLDTTDTRLQDYLDVMRLQSAMTPLEQRVMELKSSVLNLLESGLVNEAYETTRRSLPDARIFVQPLITLHTLHSTPNATANATLSFLAALFGKNERPLHGQVLLAGDFCGIHGVCGVPVNVERNGWRIREIESLTGEEKLQIVDAVTSIERYVAGVRMAPLEFSMSQTIKAPCANSVPVIPSENIFNPFASLCPA